MCLIPDLGFPDEDTLDHSQNPDVFNFRPGISIFSCVFLQDATTAPTPKLSR
jgi:hypothetical protein